MRQSVGDDQRKRHMTDWLPACMQPVQKKNVDNVHPFPNCKSAAPYNPHKNAIVRLQLLLMVTEVVPCILDKLLLRNSFVLNGRDLYEEFCFDDINALRVYNCQLGVYSFICAEGTPFYQHFLHV